MRPFAFVGVGLFVIAGMGAGVEANPGDPDDPIEETTWLIQQLINDPSSAHTYVLEYLYSLKDRLPGFAGVLCISGGSISMIPLGSVPAAVGWAEQLLREGISIPLAPVGDSTDSMKALHVNAGRSCGGSSGLVAVHYVNAPYAAVDSSGIVVGSPTAWANWLAS